jgi:hypothetical protein
LFLRQRQDRGHGLNVEAAENKSLLVLFFRKEHTSLYRSEG